MSSIIESLNKSFSVQKRLFLCKSISYKFFCTNLSKVKLEILTDLQPFSEAASKGVS